jgi:gamma-glutamyltranspeptidase
VYFALVTALLLQAAPESTTVRAPRTPAYAPDGRLVIAENGHLLIQATPSGKWVRVTSGLAWDRTPVWTPDGLAIIFSSDRGGNFDLWRLPLDASGAAGTPEQITKTPEAESAPTTAPDGAIAFVRGYGPGGRIWIRAADGSEKRLTTREQAESAPAFSPDGSRIAFIQTVEAGRRIIVRTLSTGREELANTDKNADRLAWSPKGDLIAFSAAGIRGNIFIAPTDGRFTNLVSSRHGDLAWSPDGKTIAVAEHDDATTGYNGDPDRLGERIAGEPFGPLSDKLTFIAAPIAPDANLAEQVVVSSGDRSAWNADAYDRVWQRSTVLYFSAPEAADRRAQWEQVRYKHRAEALAARNDDELQHAIYAMLRERPALKALASGRAAVASAHPVATNAGLEILRAGGNAIDAAVAVSFALGVVEPDASGVGGYGEILISSPKLGKPALVEFMSRVPEDATLSNPSLLTNGRYPVDGPVLANVPGTVAGMYAAWKKYGSGRIAWKDLLAPAIRAARNGYAVSEGLATTLSTEREHFLKYDGSKALFFRDGKPLQAGDSLKNPDLAWVLDHIAKDGADGFYKGEVAKKLVDDLHGKGNAMRLSDMARYFAPEREPVAGTYRGYTLYSSAPPVSGGAELVARLNLLEHFDKPKLYTEDAATLNAALSAWLLIPSTRGLINDPGLWFTDVAPIVSRDSANTRWACYDPNRALRPSDLRGDTLACLKPKSGSQSAPPPPVELASAPSPFAECEGPDHAKEISVCHSSGTTAYTVADAEGNVVAATQTLGTWGGNFYVTPGLGFLYNDKLTSYGTDASQYGARLAFARHGSTIAPTIVFKGQKPVFAVGAAGNAWITSAVFETILGALDFGLNPQQALELPRFLPGGAGGGGGGRGGGPGAAGVPAAPAGFSIQMEDGFSPDVIKRLRELGYDISFVSMRGELREGYGSAIAIDGKKVTAGADPRRAGAAGAIP